MRLKGSGGAGGSLYQQMLLLPQLEPLEDVSNRIYYQPT